MSDEPGTPPPTPKPPHRWTVDSASVAGRKGGQAPRVPKGLGKRTRRRGKGKS
jgi:hypothetical protein